MVKAVEVQYSMNDVTPVGVSAKNMLWHFDVGHGIKREVGGTEGPQVALCRDVAIKVEPSGKVN